MIVLYVIRPLFVIVYCAIYARMLCIVNPMYQYWCNGIKIISIIYYYYYAFYPQFRVLSLIPVPHSVFHIPVPHSAFRFRIPHSGSAFRIPVPHSAFRFRIPVPYSAFRIPVLRFIPARLKTQEIAFPGSKFQKCSGGGGCQVLE